MTILIIFFCLLILLLVWIIFVPVRLKINSSSQEYYVRQPGTFCVMLSPGEANAWQLRIFGIPVRLRSADKQIEKPEVKKKKPGMFRKKSADAWILLIKGMTRAMKIKELILQADLNDVVLNAQLFPLTQLASRGVVHLSVNFNKTYYFSLLMEARINKMLWTFVRFSTKK